MFCTCPDKSTFRAHMAALTCTEKSEEAQSLLSGGDGAALEAEPGGGTLWPQAHQEGRDGFGTHCGTLSQSCELPHPVSQCIC